MQFVEKQTSAWLVRLEPLPVDDQLRNGPLADVAQYLVRSCRIGVHIDFSV